MRPLKASLAGVAIIALLLNVSATVAVAQDDEASSDQGDFVFVEGEEVAGLCDGLECTARHVMSDPRVSGDVDIQLDLGCSADMVCWMGGGLTISNDDGEWDGRWVGFINDHAAGGRSHDQMMWLEGDGAYEGWSYVAVLTDLGRPGTLDEGKVGLHPGTVVRGVFYRGDLPPSVAQDTVPSAG